MKKEDFYKGQTVWIYLIGNLARGKTTTEERIDEWEVVSVGRKYVTCRSKRINWHEAKFDITNNFRQVYTYGTTDYVLYLSKDDIFKDLRKEKLIKDIREIFTFDNWILNKLSVEDLELIESILTGKKENEEKIMQGEKYAD